METRVTQALRGELLDVGRRHATTEGTELPVARIIDQDQQHVGRPLWRTHHLGKSRRIGVLVGAAYLSLEVKVETRQRLRRRRRWNRCRGFFRGCSRLCGKRRRNEARKG